LGIAVRLARIADPWRTREKAAVLHVPCASVGIWSIIWSMGRTQTLVQLTAEILAELDELRAREGGRSRSELIREAIERYLAEQREETIDRAIVEGYTRQPSEDLGAEWAARASIAAENWDRPR